ncbi:MAG: pitrilysin family protein [Pseudomonadota bacterium]
MFRAFIAAGLIGASAVSAETVSEFTLDNGLEVVVIEDHRAPVVVNMIWYKAGAAEEPLGVSGIAHYLEHLLFKGTDTLGPGEFSRIVEANGGSDNAFTSWDYTAYFQRVAADRLDLMMEMEADRMVNLRLTEEVAAPELKVVLEERKQRTDSDPQALFGEQARAAQYLNHPYGRPIIGWPEEIQGLTMQDALDFYETYYAPNNAVLVVAGDVTPEEVRSLAEKHFGPIPASETLPERRRPSEPPQLAERRIIFEDPRIAQPFVRRSYLAPERNSGDQEDAAALALLSAVLGDDPATSYLGRKLQFDEKLAIYTVAWYRGQTLDDTTFGIVVVPAPGVSLEEAEAALDRTLESFIADGVDPEQLNRIKRQIYASEIFAKDSTQGLARRYGAALATGLTVEDVQAWPDVLQAVTEADIMEAAASVLDKRRAVTGWVRAPEASADQEVTQ